MSRKKELMFAGGTLACAMGIGFVMQSGEQADLRYGGAVVALESSRSDAPLDIRDITLTSAPVPPQPSEVVENSPDFALLKMSPPARDPQVQSVSSKPTCEVSLTATPKDAAMIDLALSAPCHAEQAVRLSHAGMDISTRTRADGTLNIEIPALAANAVFRATFPDGIAQEASLRVDSLALYDRVLVQWSGPAGLEIHAREYGAAYGDPGHVWQANPRGPVSTEAGMGGFLSAFEPQPENPVAAQIYTFPAAVSDRETEIALTIEVRITSENCDRPIEGVAKKFMGGNLLQSQSIALPEVGCDAVGEYLVLNNLLADLTVASR